jgi:hypothetical protein
VAVQTTAAVTATDTSSLDRLTLLLAMERSETDLAAQRHLRALDAVLTEATSSFFDPADGFAWRRRKVL